jgi:stage V sporulation protein G
MSKAVDFQVKRINRLDGSGPTKAFCDIAIGETFLVKGLRVVEGKNGIFVSMPQETGKDGQWYDTALPLTKEAREQISEMVLAAYQTSSA